MNEENRNTGVELTDEDIEKATGGAGEPLVKHYIQCSSCGYSYAYAVRGDEKPIPPPCPNCGRNPIQEVPVSMP